ncbi:MAG TPA: hypothetical protein VIG03_05730 [Steroidobacteraceae bacterium]|jgi:hypothetical protein
MSNSSRIRITTRIVAVHMICAALPVAAAQANGRVTVNPQTCGSPTDPIEVLLPFEMQASYFHALPIAGLLVTPENAARRVLTNPRARATTARPLSGKKGPAYPNDPSNVVDTRADRFP